MVPRADGDATGAAAAGGVGAAGGFGFVLQVADEPLAGDSLWLVMVPSALTFDSSGLSLAAPDGQSGSSTHLD